MILSLQTYVGKDIENYFPTVPSRYKAVASLHCASMDSYFNTISRRDIDWWIGRDYDIRLLSNENVELRYLKYYKEKLGCKKSAMKTVTDPKKPSFYAFNETEKVQFFGTIANYVTVTSDLNTSQSYNVSHSLIYCVANYYPGPSESN